MEPQVKEVQPKQEEQGNNWLAVVPQALPERPSATLAGAIGGETWNECPCSFTPLLPLFFKLLLNS